MKDVVVKPIGTVNVTDDTAVIAVAEPYRHALVGLEGFSHLQVVWWFSEFDRPEMRSVLQTPKPYKHSPEVMGIFATRSPVRPNPIALSTVQVLDINVDEGLIMVPYIDAFDGTPVLDLKPYTPSIDRVEHPEVPNWCRHWPVNTETSGDFDWEDEFNF